MGSWRSLPVAHPFGLAPPCRRGAAAQEVAFEAEWAAAKENASRDHREEALLLRGTEMLLAVKPVRKAR